MSRRKRKAVARRPVPPPPPVRDFSAQRHFQRYRSQYVIVGGALFAAVWVFGSALDDDDDRKRTCVNVYREVIAAQRCERGDSGARWYYGGRQDGAKMNGGSYERGGFGGRTGSGS